MTSRRIALMFLTCVGLMGCVSPAMPPHMSFSRHLEPLEDQAGETKSNRIGLSTGAVIVSQPEEATVLTLFPSEGFLSHFGERYSGSFTAGHFLGSFEGNLLFLNDDKARFGLLHGLGLGFQREMPDDEDATSVLFYDVSAGGMLEFRAGENGTAFAAFRYTYADVMQWPAGDPFRQTDYLTFGVGAKLRLGNLEVVPELVYSRGSWQVVNRFSQPGAEAVGGQHLNYIIPMITFSASF
jgi:hypothetical protein